MKASKYLINTLRDNPQDALIESHRLMVRAGLIRKLGSGLYYFLPMGLRVLQKIEKIIRDEMNDAGALEFLLPILTPSELWEKSGRFQSMGKEMFRIKDRHDVWNVLGPTHEESFTELVKGLIRSYRDLPLNVYQMHTKFRDEIRPRFGVMRSREFIMKDAYSFDIDEDNLDATYQKMRKTYRKIFSRSGLKTLPVEADTGTMGGSASEEFMVPSEVGEEVLLISEKETYRGNREKTPVIYNEKNVKSVGKGEKKKIHTPGAATIEEVAAFFKTEIQNILKSVLFNVDGKPVLVCLSGDREVNEIKLKNHLGADEVNPGTDEDFKKLKSTAGFIGPEGIPGDIKIIRDHSSFQRNRWITGANEKDYHLENYTFDRECDSADVAFAKAGDPSPDGDGVLHEVKGIEVGHIFKLGYKYSEKFGVKVLDEKGKAVTPIMGCYGIGVNRTMAAVIEQNFDEKGIVWPLSIAPFEICLIAIAKTEDEIKKAEELYDALTESGLEVFYDERKERPGVKFNDAELIGFPIRLTMGKTYFEKDTIEVQIRKSGEKMEFSGGKAELTNQIIELKNKLKEEFDKQTAQYEKENI